MRKPNGETELVLLQQQATSTIWIHQRRSYWEDISHRSGGGDPAGRTLHLQTFSGFWPVPQHFPISLACAFPRPPLRPPSHPKKGLSYLLLFQRWISWWTCSRYRGAGGAEGWHQDVQQRGRTASSWLTLYLAEFGLNTHSYYVENKNACSNKQMYLRWDSQGHIWVRLLTLLCRCHSIVT